MKCTCKGQRIIQVDSGRSVVWVACACVATPVVHLVEAVHVYLNDPEAPNAMEHLREAVDKYGVP